MADRLIRITTAFAVVAVAVVAAVISYQHAYELVRTHGEDGAMARLVPLAVDGLVYASSMVILHAARHKLPVPVLARALLGLGIAATLAANVAHGADHGTVGAVVAAWPAGALVGSYELCMWIVRTGRTRPLPAAPGVPESVPDADPLRVRAAEAFADQLAEARVPSVRTIRQTLRVGQPKAQWVRAYLSELAADTG